jgi:glycerol-3-phosphate dehydrogenase (NAD(P)+)
VVLKDLKTLREDEGMNMKAEIAVLGASAWGTAIAKVIADKGKNVVLWRREQAVADAVN